MLCESWQPVDIFPTNEIKFHKTAVYIICMLLTTQQHILYIEQ